MKKVIWLLLAVIAAELCALGIFGADRPSEPESVDMPILLYHHLSEGEAENESTITVRRFREHMEALRAAGYEPVSFEDLRRFVEEGASLPAKPVVITFDDGYESNYTLAWPILEEYGWPATIFVIGVSMGKDTYKDTGEPMLPHFSRVQGEEMEAGGLITVASHGYDLHLVDGLDPAPVRQGVLPLEGETEEEYRAFLESDFRKMEELLGKLPGVLAYPYGQYCDLSEEILSAMGVYATVTIEEHTNTLRRGEPDTLRRMGRYYMTDDITGEALITLLEN